MSRISGIIIRVRDTLADPSGDRWSDTRLIRLIDEAQKDICRRAKLLRTKVNLSVTIDEAVVQLPDDLLVLDRVLYRGNVLPFTSHLELDKRLGNWEEEVGEPKLIVYDKQSKKQVKLYPIPNDKDMEAYPFTNSEYGTVTDITGLSVDDYGVVSDIKDIEVKNNIFESSVYGIVVDIYETNDYLTVYYLRKPMTITELNSSIEIDDNYDAAIKYYVTGKALRDDMDTQNRVVGNEELGFYDRELKEALKDDEFDFTRNHTQYSANYQGAF